MQVKLSTEEIEDLLTVTEFATEQLAVESDEEIRDLMQRINNLHTKLLTALQQV